MKKRGIISAIVCSICLIASNAVPAMADAVKVVTLGADLTDDQKNTMMRYFKVDSSQVQVLTITNQDERDHLSAYVPLEQIGTRTVSCAYVKPTQSGGIKVRTANLNWVTCNMIATTLSTSGVTNCEVVAACPFEVSGTGALTGILMAYETASGEKLDETKKDLATQEMVVTGEVAQDVGQDDATSVINEAKMQVLSGNVQDANEIYNIVVNIAEQNNTSLSSEQLDRIVELLEQIAQQDYDYEEMKETLETVEENVSGEPVTDDGDEFVEDSGDDASDGDSIVEDLDESILGDDVIAGSTEDPSLAEETQSASAEEEWDYTEETDDGAGEIAEDDWDYTEESVDGGEEVADTDGESEEIPVDEGTDTLEVAESSGDEMTAESGEETLTPDSLDADSRTLYDRAEKFCKGEYEGDAEALQEAMDGAVAIVALEDETGSKLTERVLKEYLQILLDNGASYVPSDADLYITPQLNQLNNKMMQIFGLTVDESGAEDILASVSAEDKQTLYDDTMIFFESLYGESVKSYDEVVETEGEMPEETSEEAVEEVYE
ncbi:DUF1002 domain-containing protein [Blautia sp. HCP3S3_G3]|uniref:DUF1002 domain-containing protein n=1 Tax=Blautia sp. HCP3S3_G3 TaxID=3438913 RepID=UPI003F89E2E6